ncbi:MAG: hypothetical protein IAF38_13325 [Bacteroidia bacterium]|nr:hypothetical protein [Bacteroidia bacterium]
MTGRSNGNAGFGEDLLYIIADTDGNELHRIFKGSTGTDIGYKSIVSGNFIFTVGKKEITTGNTDGWIICQPISVY